MTTRRLLKTEKTEHETRQCSAVYKHTSISKNNHKIDFSNPNILANDCNKIRLLMKESLNITEPQELVIRAAQRQGDELQHYSNETSSTFRQLYVINTQDIHTNGAHFE